MNNDLMPDGTWSWLEALGYSRSDVEKITRRRLRAKSPAEDEGKEIPGGSYSGLYPFPKINRVLDAEPMTKRQIKQRRLEAMHMHDPRMTATEVLLRYDLVAFGN